MSLDLNAITVDAATLSAPVITNLTTSAIDGTGVFDKLMGVVKLHLNEEYEAGRITGEEYTTVYLGALTSVMQQSVAYLLSQQQADKIAAEIGLLRQQTVTELAQTTSTIPNNLGFNTDLTVAGVIALEKTKLTAETAAVEQGTLKLTAETANVTQTTLKTTEETDLITQTTAKTLAETNAIADARSKVVAETALTTQTTAKTLADTNKVAYEITKLSADTDKVTEEIARVANETLNVAAATGKVTAETSLVGKQELQVVGITTKLTNDKAKIDKEIEVMTQQILNYQTELLKLTAEIDVLEQQKDIAAAEILLTEQKVVTEIAQTSDTKNSDDGLMAGTTITGIAGANIEKITQEVSTLAQQINKSIQEVINLGVEKTLLDEKVIEAGHASNVMKQKVVTEIAQTNDTTLTSYGLMGVTEISGISGATINKLEEEKDKLIAEQTLLKQKTVTETAQTSDSISEAAVTGTYNATASLSGLVAAQKTLLTQQAAGFARDAEQKLAKIAADILAVNISMGTSLTSDESGFSRTQIAQIISQARIGIGLPS